SRARTLSVRTRRRCAKHPAKAVKEATTAAGTHKVSAFLGFTGFHLKKKPTLRASPLLSRAQQIDTTDRTHKNIRGCPDRRINFHDVMCAHKLLNYLMCISELAMDFNDDVAPK